MAATSPSAKPGCGKSNRRLGAWVGWARYLNFEIAPVGGLGFPPWLASRAVPVCRRNHQTALDRVGKRAKEAPTNWKAPHRTIIVATLRLAAKAVKTSVVDFETAKSSERTKNVKDKAAVIELLEIALVDSETTQKGWGEKCTSDGKATTTEQWQDSRM